MAGEASTMAPPPIVLFGYDSSPFTHKVKLALKLRQIPYTFIVVPSMMPRPLFIANFNLTYRKIPIMAIGKELYIDTSLILEVIAHHPSYPPSKSHPPLHTTPQTRTLSRILSSHYTDRPLFRLTTGLIPQSVWETSFGHDRAGLIGHKLNAQKLGAKIPRNLIALDTYLSILEPLWSEHRDQWFLSTPSPTAADIALYYQLDWGSKISRGIGIQDLTGGGTRDTSTEGMHAVFNPTRYPALHAWFTRAQSYFDGLPSVETRIERTDTKSIDGVMSTLDASDQPGPVPLLPTPAPQLPDLDAQNGLVLGGRVSVAPDDTGRADPTLGSLVAITPEEVVIVPDLIEGREGRVRGVRVHFPRVGFVVVPLKVGEGVDAELRVTVRAGKARL